MPNGLIIFIAVFVVTIVISSITRWLRKQQEAEQERLSRERSSGRANRAETKGDAFDKYVEEIERLRKKPKDREPLSADRERKPVPKRAKPVAQPVSVPTVQPKRKLEELPVATPVAVVPTIEARGPAAPPEPPAPPTPATIRTISRAGQTTDPGRVAAPITELARLLKSPQGPAVAIALAEILGPPKSRQ
ncbi:MAG: hypothetical protein ACRC8S_18320 [Fimbriiglobus sp.]